MASWRALGQRIDAGGACRVPVTGAVHIGQGSWRSWLQGPRLEKELIPADVVPGAILVADLCVDANRREAQRLVQANASWVGQGHAGIGIDVSLMTQQLE